jgi:hypothetical protein
MLILLRLITAAFKAMTSLLELIVSVVAGKESEIADLKEQLAIALADDAADDEAVAQAQADAAAARELADTAAAEAAELKAKVEADEAEDAEIRAYLESKLPTPPAEETPEEPVTEPEA